MSDQSKLGLGQIITTEQHKDAVHIAVAPVVAAQRFSPGERVGLDEQGRAIKAGYSIGVVDPFLQEFVDVGERFWLYLYPGSITSLRHEWSHPAFQEAPKPTAQIEGDKEASEAWLREYASRHWDYTPEDDRYDKMMSQIKRGELCYEGTDMHSLSDLEDAHELQRHASIVLGRPVIWGEFQYFSCTC